MATREHPSVTSRLTPSPERSLNSVDERELLARLRAGDERTFRALVADLGPSMLRVASVYARDRQVAAEIVQETWVGVLGGLDNFEGRSSLRTWVFTILANCARRRAKTEARSAPFSSLNAGAAEESELDCFFPSNHLRWASCWTTINTRWEALPENALSTEEADAAIMATLKSLPPKQGAVITLRDIEGWSSDEVCTLLGLSAANQRVLLHRARLAVRRALGEVLA
ncbi:MAG: RNA polymerase sigma factor [Chloroflexota bacterium]|nr:RNA polymerase sigma factor [Chloroflexota bacterium]